MTKTKVIYHKADYDGIFCREIARKFLPDAELIGWDYGDSIPQVDLTDQLYMLDISVNGLIDHPYLIWIDHHKSAMDKFRADTKGYRIDGVAACRLVWQWLAFDEPTTPYHLPDKKAFIDRIVTEPFAVCLAGEYDIWDKHDARAELFQHGLKK